MNDIQQITRELRESFDRILQGLAGTVASVEKLQTLVPQMSEVMDRIFQDCGEPVQKVPVIDIHLADAPRSKHVQPVNKRLTPEQVAVIADLHRLGRTPQEISAETGFSYSSVWYRVQKLEPVAPKEAAQPQMDFRDSQVVRPSTLTAEQIQARRQLIINAAKKQGNFK